MTTPTQTLDPSPDATDDARRREAIDVSGWGEPFHFWQPRNACLWVFVALVVTGLVKMVQMFAPLAGYYAPAFSAGAAIAVISTLGWAWWFHHLDRFERQPFTVVLACFLWGGLAAPFAIGIPGNTALGSLYSKIGGAVWGANWSAGLSAPFVEESAKAAGFILILGLAHRVVRTPADGIFLGAFIGLGFQTFEDFLYVVAGATASFGSDQVGEVTSGIVSPLHLRHRLPPDVLRAGVLRSRVSHRHPGATTSSGTRAPPGRRRHGDPPHP